MAERPFASEPLARLRTHHDTARAAMVRARHELQIVTDELVQRYGDRFKSLLHNQGREHGESTSEEEGFRLKMAVDRTITWDQDMLRTLMMELPWEVAKELIAMKLSVPERAYKRITDPNLKGRIDGARTVENKPVQITFAD